MSADYVGEAGGSFDEVAPLAPLGGGAKRACDLALALLAIIFLMPLMIVLALLIRLQDGGPAVYRQQRIGYAGRAFGCLKFRTMVKDAPERLAALLASDPEAMAEWTAAQKLRSDPRITRMGAFLRKTSLDELPQLFNIVRGEMSLVGPRPIVEAEVERYDRSFASYARSRPGLTGLWQVSGRSDASYAARVNWDVDYVQRWSMAGDLAIMVRTVPAVLLGKGSI
jgi:exopolysaccharide production protein ExoY